MVSPLSTHTMSEVFGPQLLSITGHTEEDYDIIRRVVGCLRGGSVCSRESLERAKLICEQQQVCLDELLNERPAHLSAIISAADVRRQACTPALLLAQSLLALRVHVGSTMGNLRTDYLRLIQAWRTEAPALKVEAVNQALESCAETGQPTEEQMQCFLDFMFATVPVEFTEHRAKTMAHFASLDKVLLTTVPTLVPYTEDDLMHLALMYWLVARDADTETTKYFLHFSDLSARVRSPAPLWTLPGAAMGEALSKWVNVLHSRNALAHLMQLPETMETVQSVITASNEVFGALVELGSVLGVDHSNEFRAYESMFKPSASKPLACRRLGSSFPIENPDHLWPAQWAGFKSLDDVNTRKTEFNAIMMGVTEPGLRTRLEKLRVSSATELAWDEWA